MSNGKIVHTHYYTVHVTHCTFYVSAQKGLMGIPLYLDAIDQISVDKGVMMEQ